MTLLEIINLIEGIAGMQPNINTIIDSGDIYDCNTLGNVEYSAFCLTQQQHTQSTYFTTYNFYMFYVDRLESDLKNKIQIQSAGIQALTNIVKSLEDRYDIDVEGDIQYNVFTQRFASECAGVYATLSVKVPISNCYTDYD